MKNGEKFSNKIVNFLLWRLDKREMLCYYIS
jgi:hypothetical protein